MIAVLGPPSVRGETPPTWSERQLGHRVALALGLAAAALLLAWVLW